jgi:Protein of unknown function (DUF998)
MTTKIDQKTARKKAEIFFLAGVYILMILAMFILPLFLVPDQSIVRNTLSELGAQFFHYSWIMNTIFVALAFSSVISGWGCFDGFAFQRFLLVLFGTSLTLAAIFNHAPADPDIQYNISEDGWHTYFTCTTWLTFIILAFSTAMILERPVYRLLSIATGISVLLLLLLTFEAPKVTGIWQRLLFIISFGWMIHTFRIMDN